MGSKQEMAQRYQGSSAAGVTIVVVLVLVLASIGYYQYVFAPSLPTSTTTTLPSITVKTVMINITLNAAGDCGGASAIKTSQPATCNAYSPNPAKLVIGVNNSVVFNNIDSAVHTATADDKTFDTGILQAGQQSNPILIDKAGTYPYYCAVHPWMKGELIVVQGSATTPQTTSAASSGSARSSTSSTVTRSSGAGVKVTIPGGTATDTSSTGYSPDTIRVLIGVNNTVIWTNDDTAPHTVTASDKSFDSGNLAPGQSFSYTFTTPGTYDYLCLYHSWMKGTVVVVKG